jgi:hypothetical protein
VSRMRRGRGYRFGVRTADLLAHWFPGAMVICMLTLLFQLVRRPSWPLFLVVVLIPYAVPLMLFRAICLFAPVREGSSVLAKDVWSSWFISYRLQLIYGYFPFLEGALLAIPGVFNLWLRAWGSRVGKRVFWAALVQVTDRGHLDIGDDVMFGNAVYLSPHVMQRRRARGVLYVKRISVGAGAFVGAGVRMGPGVVVEPGALVPLLTDLYVKQRFPALKIAGNA